MLSKFAHDIWAHWMRHYLGLKPTRADYARWRRLSQTEFEDLTDDEKASDTVVAEKYSAEIGRRLLRLDLFLENLNDYGLDPKQVRLIREHFEK